MKKITVKNKPIILITRKITDQARAILNAIGEVRMASGTEENILIEECRDIDAILIGALGEENAEVGRAQTTKSAVITPRILEHAPKLKVIGHAANPMPKGQVENVALWDAQARGITIVHVPQSYPYSIADYTMALILSLARKLPTICHLTKHERIFNLPADEYLGLDVSFKTIGLIGFGRIARLVARRTLAFEMPTLVYDPYTSRREILAAGATPEELDTLLAVSDIVSCHIPECATNHHAIGVREFKLMKRGALFINTAWGANAPANNTCRVVDEQALIAALQDGTLGGAAIDCFEENPPRPDNPLFTMKNVIVTPYWAYRVKSMWPDVCVAEDIVRVLNGERPVHAYVP